MSHARRRAAFFTGCSPLGHWTAEYAAGAIIAAGASVGLFTAIGALAILVLAFAVPIWALRKHNRMFPKGWDRTGWEPEPGKARRFETMWTYFSGGRGS